jgi:hypothetical protein
VGSVMLQTVVSFTLLQKQMRTRLSTITAAPAVA